jgi:prefoldin subunit 5
VNGYRISKNYQTIKSILVILSLFWLFFFTPDHLYAYQPCKQCCKLLHLFQAKPQGDWDEISQKLITINEKIDRLDKMKKDLRDTDWVAGPIPEIVTAIKNISDVTLSILSNFMGIKTASGTWKVVYDIADDIKNIQGLTEDGLKYFIKKWMDDAIAEISLGLATLKDIVDATLLQSNMRQDRIILKAKIFEAVELLEKNMKKLKTELDTLKPKLNSIASRLEELKNIQNQLCPSCNCEMSFK